MARERKNALRESINRYLWSEEKGAYYPYFVKEQRHGDCLMVSTFCPLRMEIAPPERRLRLLTLLTSHEHFNWDTIPLTSVAKTDAEFQTTRGRYQGNPSWSGNVWTLTNEAVVRGLCDCGDRALAAELAYKTVLAFHQNCVEFVNPFDGSGHGVLKYAWSASQYLELIVEVLFGISYDAVLCKKQNP